MTGGAILTMDASKPTAEALAVIQGRILMIGSNADVARFVGPRTRVIKLNGRGVTPGLVDAHAHLLGLGNAMESVSLRGSKSQREAAERAAQAAHDRTASEWVTGRGWDQNLWKPQQFPTRAVLDELIPNHPVSLRRIDGHALWANTKAVQLAGVDKDTPDPDGGKIMRDDAGEPTGVFVDAAMSLIESNIPDTPPAVVRRRILAAARSALAAGLTGVHEMGISLDTADIYRTLADEDRLPLRIYAFLAGSPELIDSLPNRVIEVDTDGTEMFVARSVKLFADGALGSRGAALLEPYSDDPDNKGLWITSADELKRSAVIAAGAGWQVGTHAIGDAANRAVLDAYAAARAAQPDADLRFRVEHAQVLAKQDIPRFAELEVIASMQPTHCTSDMPWAGDRLGPEREKGAYAWRQLLDSGAHLAAGSDFPVEEVSPLLGIYAATTRQDAQGKPPGGWNPQEKMTLNEAVYAFTVESAYASFSEQSRGKLRPGYVADITVYDRALEGGAALLETKIDMTIVGGVVAFERN